MGAAERVTRLRLPISPSLNRMNAAHPIELHKAKRRYQAAVWASALQQVRPLLRPPPRVEVQATLYVRALRDEDSATGGLKWALDALRQRQRGSLRWRQGLADQCGYFVDDDPARLTLLKPTQVVHLDQRLELVITPLPPEEEAP